MTRWYFLTSMLGSFARLRSFARWAVCDDQCLWFWTDNSLLHVLFILSLDIKPSTLEYRSIPSTKVSINTLDAKATLDVSMKCSPDYPYISFINISLVEIPAFSLRIEPQGERWVRCHQNCLVEEKAFHLNYSCFVYTFEPPVDWKGLIWGHFLLWAVGSKAALMQLFHITFRRITFQSMCLLGWMRTKVSRTLTISFGNADSWADGLIARSLV